MPEPGGSFHEFALLFSCGTIFSCGKGGTSHCTIWQSISVILYIETSLHFSQFCILIKPKLLNWSGGKAVLTQIWHKTHINSKKTRISKLQFGEERYYNWLNQIKSVFKIFLPSLIPQILICARLCIRYWIYWWIGDIWIQFSWNV